MLSLTGAPAAPGFPGVFTKQMDANSKGNVNQTYKWWQAVEKHKYRLNLIRC